jgi:N-acetylmuramoyl-L-alanine amidase
LKAVEPGDRGLAVSDVQKRLRDLGFVRPGFDSEMGQAYYGEQTARIVRDFQEMRGLRANGSVDETTWHELVEASFHLGDRFIYLRIPPFRGDDVRKIQRYLNSLGFNSGREDGIFGQDTDLALRAFQHNTGLPVDGIAGSTTISCLMRLEHAIKDTSVAEVHEILQDEAARGLEGRSVVLDAAEEDAFSENLMRQTCDELQARGVSVIITGGVSGSISESQRARLANDYNVDVVLGLRSGDGLDCRLYYFGSGTYSSPRGRRLADILFREIIGWSGRHIRTPVCKSYPLLRETRMPCVIVEAPQFIAAAEGFSSILADSLFNYFQPVDSPTGVSGGVAGRPR